MTFTLLLTSVNQTMTRGFGNLELTKFNMLYYRQKKDGGWYLGATPLN